MQISSSIFGHIKEGRESGLIPERVQRLFWDTDKKTVDLRAHGSYIIRRIMDYGDKDDVRWMLAAYSAEVIIGVVKKSRGLSRKSGSFWGSHFGIPKEEIACLKELYQRRPTPF